MVDTEYFIFKGINSVDLDIAIDDSWLPPEELPAKEVQYIEIPGRDGYLTIDKNRYKPLNKTIIGAAINSDHFPMIEQWLQGEGELVISTNPNCYYKARVVENVKYNHKFEGVKVFSVNFICQPTKFYLSGRSAITLTSKPATIINPGAESKPLIKVTGSGAIDLEINSQMLHLTVDGYQTIDSELMECYKGTTLATFTGEFPLLIPGANTIIWTGTVTSVEVIPRWRK